MFNADTSSVVALVKELCDAAYEKGFADGAAATRHAVLQAASGIVPQLEGNADKNFDHVIVVDPPRRSPRERAARGAVVHAVARMLVRKPGMTMSEMEKAAAREFPDIAPKSFGNELRRYEGSRYKRDRPGGYRWFLIEQDVPGEEHGGSEGGETPSAVDDVFG